MNSRLVRSRYFGIKLWFHSLQRMLHLQQSVWSLIKNSSIYFFSVLLTFFSLFHSLTVKCIGKFKVIACLLERKLCRIEKRVHINFPRFILQDLFSNLTNNSLISLSFVSTFVFTIYAEQNILSLEKIIRCAGSSWVAVSIQCSNTVWLCSYAGVKDKHRERLVEVIQMTQHWSEIFCLFSNNEVNFI